MSVLRATFPHFYGAEEVFKCLRSKIASWTPIRPASNNLPDVKHQECWCGIFEGWFPGDLPSEYFPISYWKRYSAKKIA